MIVSFDSQMLCESLMWAWYAAGEVVVEVSDGFADAGAAFIDGGRTGSSSVDGGAIGSTFNNGSRAAAVFVDGCSLGATFTDGDV